MKIVNFGSLNIDHAYRVERIARDGETIASTGYTCNVGGKGLNQSIALARAGAHVVHAGRIGRDGAMLRRCLQREGVDVSLLEEDDGSSGHAIIQVDCRGENAIIVEGGANARIDTDQVERVLEAVAPSDWLLLQNEINGIPGIMDAAVRRGLRIALNPAPMDGAVRRRGTGGMDLLFVNASEGAALTGCDAPDDIIAALRHAAPTTRIVLTMGSQGAVYADGTVRIQQAADPVQAVDTTAAGDTFIGFFLAAQLRSMDVATALQLAGRAAALCVTRHGAADAIPVLAEVEGPDA